MVFLVAGTQAVTVGWAPLLIAWVKAPMLETPVVQTAMAAKGLAVTVRAAGLAAPARAAQGYELAPAFRLVLLRLVARFRAPSVVR